MSHSDAMKVSFQQAFNRIELPHSSEHLLYIQSRQTQVSLCVDALETKPNVQKQM